MTDLRQSQSHFKQNKPANQRDKCISVILLYKTITEKGGDWNPLYGIRQSSFISLSFSTCYKFSLFLIAVQIKNTWLFTVL